MNIFRFVQAALQTICLESLIIKQKSVWQNIKNWRSFGNEKNVKIV